jgi:hypothetical protein
MESILYSPRWVDKGSDMRIEEYSRFGGYCHSAIGEPKYPTDGWERFISRAKRQRLPLTLTFCLLKIIFWSKRVHVEKKCWESYCTRFNLFDVNIFLIIWIFLNFLPSLIFHFKSIRTLFKGKEIKRHLPFEWSLDNSDH